MANNRKTTHRRRNGRLVTVRLVQYPPSDNSKPKYDKAGIVIKSGRKSAIKHPGTSPVEQVISGIGYNTKHKENLPNKGKERY